MLLGFIIRAFLYGVIVFPSPRQDFRSYLGSRLARIASSMVGSCLGFRWTAGLELVTPKTDEGNADTLKRARQATASVPFLIETKALLIRSSVRVTSSRSKISMTSPWRISS